MNHVLLHCLSDADTRFEAVVDVRSCLAEHLVNVDVSDECVPLGISRSEIPGNLTFYCARASGGGVFDSRPYENIDVFLDEFRSVLGHDLYRIAKFEQEQKSRSFTEDEPVRIDGDKDRMMSLAKDLMERVNSMDVNPRDCLLGKIFDELSFQRVSDKNLVYGVDSHLYSMVLDDKDLGFSEYLRDDGPWIVKESTSFDGRVHKLYPEEYGFDCTGRYPSAVSMDELDNREDGFLVEVETKY